MDFIKLFGSFIAVLFHQGSASKIHGERICRRGTERPCYKAFYFQDIRRRLSFEDARQSCRSDGGELLSIETESEQRLIERFIQELKFRDGDFWIGLRRSPLHHRAGNTGPGCPSQYYWLDGSKAKYRNWHWDEPSCGTGMCAVLYHQPFALRDEDGHFLFQWNDDKCSSKNNFVCKYREEKVPAFTGDRITAKPVPSLRPSILSTTKSNDNIEIRTPFPESSVSLSETPLYVSYILYATIPVLLLLLFAAAGFFCYRQHAKRRKTETETYSSRSKQWTSTAASPCPVQGPYAFSDVTKLPLDCTTSAEILKKYSCDPSHDSQCGDYENVRCSEKESGFVTNDIYEPCRGQSRRCCGQTGWVENEIYG